MIYNRLNQTKEENHRLRSTWIFRGNTDMQKMVKDLSNIPCPKVECRNRKGQGAVNSIIIAYWLRLSQISWHSSPAQHLWQWYWARSNEYKILEPRGSVLGG